MIGAAWAMGMAVVGPAHATEVARQEVWTPALSPSGAFSVETPCGESEVAALRTAPNDFVIGVVAQSRVLCEKAPMLFLAGVLLANDLPAGVSSLFDFVVQKSSKGGSARDTPTMSTIDGRRAFFRRAEEAGALIQTGYVEVSQMKVIVLAAGAEGNALSIATQGRAIDRFYASVKVIGQ